MKHAEFVGYCVSVVGAIVCAFWWTCYVRAGFQPQIVVGTTRAGEIVRIDDGVKVGRFGILWTVQTPELTCTLTDAYTYPTHDMAQQTVDQLPTRSVYLNSICPRASTLCMNVHEWTNCVDSEMIGADLIAVLFLWWMLAAAFCWVVWWVFAEPPKPPQAAPASLSKVV